MKKGEIYEGVIEKVDFPNKGIVMVDDQKVIVKNGIHSKVFQMPTEAQRKMRKTLGRIVNEGKGGIICILL